MPVSKKPRKSERQKQTVGANGKQITHPRISWEQRMFNSRMGYANAVDKGLV